MAQLGLHLRLNDVELAELESLQGFEAMNSYIADTLEVAKFGTDAAAQTDASWAYIHSALIGIDPDGPLERTPEDASLADLGAARYAIMGSEVLLSSDDAYFGLTRDKTVGEVADEIAKISVADLSARVAKAHVRFKADGSPKEAAEYAAGWFPGLVKFFQQAAQRKEHVLFTVTF